MSNQKSEAKNPQAHVADERALPPFPECHIVDGVDVCDVEGGAANGYSGEQMRNFVLADRAASTQGAVAEQSETHDRGPWHARSLKSGVPFFESDDFTHDVRLYVNGDFADNEQRAAYCANVVAALNRAAGAPAETPKPGTLSELKARIVHHKAKLDDDDDIHCACSSMIVSELERILAAQPAPATEAQGPAGATDAISVDALCALLPGAYYMDLPDGGDVTVLEQLRRMSVDSARYRWLESQLGGSLSIDLDCGKNEIGATIDAAMLAPANSEKPL